jgi:hypothetical protein
MVELQATHMGDNLPLNSESTMKPLIRVAPR